VTSNSCIYYYCYCYYLPIATILSMNERMHYEYKMRKKGMAIDQ